MRLPFLSLYQHHVRCRIFTNISTAEWPPSSGEDLSLSSARETTSKTADPPHRHTPAWIGHVTNRFSLFRIKRRKKIALIWILCNKISSLIYLARWKGRIRRTVERSRRRSLRSNCVFAGESSSRRPWCKYLAGGNFLSALKTNTHRMYKEKHSHHLRFGEFHISRFILCG